MSENSNAYTKNPSVLSRYFRDLKNNFVQQRSQHKQQRAWIHNAESTLHLSDQILKDIHGVERVEFRHQIAKKKSRLC